MRGGIQVDNLNGASRAYGTIVFSDLCGSTELGDRLEPEELATVILEVKSILTSTIEQFGGTILQFQGDGVLAVFGYPDPSESAPRNAVSATLAAHHHARTAFADEARGLPRIRLHSGVHSGIFLVRPGDKVDGKFALFGDTVNSAARLCSIAGPDEVIASNTTLGGLDALYDLKRLPAVTLKGKREPFLVSSVRSLDLPSSLNRRRKSHLKTPFAGRDAEIERLNDIKRIVEEGATLVAALVGEPGIGKTRLATEFIESARRGGAISVQGYCEDFGECGPLQPIAQILHDLLSLTPVRSAGGNVEAVRERFVGIDERLSDHVETFARVMGVSETGLISDASLGEVADALCELFTVLSQQGLLVVFVDDWQWADDASRHVLNRIFQKNLPERLLVILTVREGSLDDAALSFAESIAVRALSLSDSAGAIANVSTIIPDGSLMEQVYEYSGGNPLYLEEIAHHLDAGTFDFLIKDNVFSISANLPSLIEARLSAISIEDRWLVQSASVLGNVVDLELFSQIANDEGDKLRHRLLSTGFFSPGRRENHVHFKHGLTREAIYNGMGLTERRGCHSSAALEIRDRTKDVRSGQNSEILAYHYAGAGQHQSALDCAETAAEKALGAFSLDRTRSYFVGCVNALNNLDTSEEVRRRFVQVCDKFSVSCVYGPSVEHVRILEQGAEYAVELGDHGALARINRWIGYLNYVLGSQDDAIDRFERALAGANSVDDPIFVLQVRANLGQAYAAAGEYAQALKFLDPALEACDEAIRTHKHLHVVAAYATTARSLVYADMGRFDRANEEIDIALHVYGGANHVVEASIRNMRCTGMLWRGDWAAVLEEVQVARRLAERSGATYVLGCSLGMLGYAQCKTGALEQGMTNLRQAGALLEGRGLRLFQSLFYSWLADCLYDAGQIDEARSAAEKAIERGTLRDPLGDGLANRVLAAIAASDPDQGIDKALELLNLARRNARFRNAPHEDASTDLREAEILLQCERASDAVALLENAREVFETLGMRSHAANASRKLAEI